MRAIDPAHGFQLDTTVVLGGGLVLLVLLLMMLAWVAWRAVRPAQARISSTRPSLTARVAASSGWPLPAALGTSYALDAPPGARQMGVRSNLVGCIIAVAAVVAAVIFGSSLNGLVSHPQRYGWNWDALVQNEGGYGSFLPQDVNAATLGDGEGVLDQRDGTRARCPRVVDVRLHAASDRRTGRPRPRAGHPRRGGRAADGERDDADGHRGHPDRQRPGPERDRAGGVDAAAAGQAGRRHRVRRDGPLRRAG